MSRDYIISINNLSKKFGKNYALQDVNLNIGSGKIVGLLGPNGSGKTTLIKILNGLIKQTDGDVFIDGVEPSPYTKSIVSYLPDKPYFAKWMKVKDALNLFQSFYEDFDREKALAMCENLGISERDKIKSMSKGTKEKVELILTMSRNAKLYLLDEPIGGVDPAARDYILDTIISNFNEDATIIISTHLISDIEKVLDDVIFIKAGNIIEFAAVDDLKANGKSIDEQFRESFKMNK